jgi:type I restriction enzyme S subunit
VSWPCVALSKVANVFNGKTPSKEEQRNGGHPVLKIKDVDDTGVFKGEFQSFVDFELVERFESKKLELDDTLILNAAHNSDYVGSKQYCAESKVVGALPTGEWLIARANQEYLHPRFLNYWLASSQARFQIKQLVKGIHIYPKDVARLEIPLPPLPEQKRIAAILDKADAIRRKRQLAIQLADEFLRSVFLNMFGDPVTNPKGFRIGPITELADIITGNAFKSAEYVEDSSESVRLCRGANTLTGYFDWTDTVYWPKDKLKQLDNYLINGGDIILAMDRPWISNGLKVCIFPENERSTYLVQRVARLRPKSLIYTDFIYFCSKSRDFDKHC